MQLQLIRHRVQEWSLRYNVKLQQCSKKKLLELTNVLKVILKSEEEWRLVCFEVWLKLLQTFFWK